MHLHHLQRACGVAKLQIKEIKLLYVFIYISIITVALVNSNKSLVTLSCKIYSHNNFILIVLSPVGSLNEYCNFNSFKSKLNVNELMVNNGVRNYLPRVK